jgi:hypothetical protein
VFGPFANDTFGTVPRSMVTLYCLLNGDSVLQLFTEINQTSFFPLRLFSRLFVMVFLAYFINNALNIALAIVVDAYAQVKDLFAVCEFDVDRANVDATVQASSGTEIKPPKRPHNKPNKEATQPIVTARSTAPAPLDRLGATAMSADDELSKDSQQLRKLARRLAMLAGQ